MRRLSDITVDDLKQTPIWQHLGGDDDCATVCPATSFAETDYCGYIALTRFVLSDGAEMVGYCSPQDDSGMDYVQPVMLCAGKPVRLWKDGGWDAEQERQVLDWIGKDKSDVFPIKFECCVPLEGQRLIATILDFNEMGGRMYAPEPAVGHNDNGSPTAPAG